MVQMFHCRVYMFSINSLCVTYNDKHSTLAELLKQGRFVSVHNRNLPKTLVLPKEKFIVSGDTSLTFSK